MKKHNVKPNTYCRPTLQQGVEIAKCIKEIGIDSRFHPSISVLLGGTWGYKNENFIYYTAGTFFAFRPPYGINKMTEITPEEFMKQLKNEDMELSEQVKELERENKELKARLEKKEKPKYLYLGERAFDICPNGDISTQTVSAIDRHDNQYEVGEHIYVHERAPVEVKITRSHEGGIIITFPYKD